MGIDGVKRDLIGYSSWMGSWDCGVFVRSLGWDIWNGLR